MKAKDLSLAKIQLQRHVIPAMATMMAGGRMHYLSSVLLCQRYRGTCPVGGTSSVQ